MQKVDGDHAHGLVVFSGGHGEGELDKALRADEVGLEPGAQRIAAPGDAVDVGSAAGKQRIVEGDTQGLGFGHQRGGALAHAGKQSLGLEALLGKQAVGGRPVFELLTAGGQKTGQGVASEAQQRTQREGLGALVDALLGVEGRAGSPELFEAVEEAGRVFFRTGPGAWGRRRASRLLCSTSHSTVSPRENSMA